MKNANVVRTATVATLAAFIVATGLMNSPQEVSEDPPRFHFPAAYQLEPGAGEPEVFEYH